MPEKTSPKALVGLAKHLWIIERDYEELNEELGLGQYEGRAWRRFTITLLQLSQRMGSWSLPGAVIPLPAPATLDYQPRCRASARAGRRVRPERHNPTAIPTLRRVIARFGSRNFLTAPSAGRALDDPRHRYRGRSRTRGAKGLARRTKDHPIASPCRVSPNRDSASLSASPPTAAAVTLPAALEAQHPQLFLLIPPQSVGTTQALEPFVTQTT